MSPDLLVARTMLLVPVLLSAILLFMLCVVLARGFGTWKREGSPPGWMMQHVLGLSILQLMVLAAMDVGQALVLFGEHGLTMAAIAAVFFVPWIGGQTVIKAMKSKAGEVGQIGGAP